MATVLFLIAMLALLANQVTWFMWSTVAILLSQILILSAWQDARFGTLANCLLLIATVVGFGVWKFDRMTNRDRFDLNQHAQSALQWPNQPGPPFIRQWINRSGIPDRTLLRVNLRQSGRMRITPNGKWLPFSAEQEFTPQSPGFIWTTRVDVFPGIFLLGRDFYHQGEGQMKIDLYGLIPVVHASGNELDQGTLLRYLGETVWFPSGALHPCIQWESSGPNQAVATMTWGKTQASGTFTFSPEGDFQKYQALRYYNRPDGPTLENWVIQAEPNSFRNFRGVASRPALTSPETAGGRFPLA
ncbi:MAG: hypothetical protein IPJ06_15350 [Saprospiraceae bacterium]|nr:hypothetical protein [Saprospiraceae bacterium]